MIHNSKVCDRIRFNVYLWCILESWQSAFVITDPKHGMVGAKCSHDVSGGL